jgi:hypothetical protein
MMVAQFQRINAERAKLLAAAASAHERVHANRQDAAQPSQQ